jgi:hypothetical protein
MFIVHMNVNETHEVKSSVYLIQCLVFVCSYFRVMSEFRMSVSYCMSLSFWLCVIGARLPQSA